MAGWLRPAAVSVCLLAAVYAVSVRYRPELVGMKYSLTGKSSEQCGLLEAMASARASYDQVERQNLLNHSSRTVVVDETAGLVQVETPEGRWWVPKGSEWTLSYHLAEQDRQVYGELRPGQIILDCGANIGTFTKRVAGQASLVAAIEPSPENLVMPAAQPSAGD